MKYFNLKLNEPSINKKNNLLKNLTIIKKIKP